jgi:hypothetical protein
MSTLTLVHFILPVVHAITTGNKKVSVVVNQAPTENGLAAAPVPKCRDEIKLYLDARYMCSMDAMWRILGYHTYPASTPSVQTIKIKTEPVVNQLLVDGKSCDMLAYVHRPASLAHLKYTELFTTYLSGKYSPTLISRPCFTQSGR